jgi:3-oxoadipate enol-lactonase
MDWIEVNGTRLRYDLRGAGERVLVLVHEMGGTLELGPSVADPDVRALDTAL